MILYRHGCSIILPLDKNLMLRSEPPPPSAAALAMHQDFCVSSSGHDAFASILRDSLADANMYDALSEVNHPLICADIMLAIRAARPVCAAVLAVLRRPVLHNAVANVHNGARREQKGLTLAQGDNSIHQGTDWLSISACSENDPGSGCGQVPLQSLQPGRR